MVERRPTDVEPGPRLRLAVAAIVLDLVSPRCLLNKLPLGLAVAALPESIREGNINTMAHPKKTTSSIFSLGVRVYQSREREREREKKEKKKGKTSGCPCW